MIAAVLALVGILVLLALMMRLRSRKTGRPWVQRFVKSAALVTLIIFGAPWLGGEYETHVNRGKAANLILTASSNGMARGKIAGIDAKAVIHSVSVDGGIEFTCEIYPATVRSYVPTECRQ